MNKFRLIFILTLVGAALTSCLNKDYHSKSETSDDVLLEIKVSTGELTTKAGEEKPMNHEKAIKSLRVYAFTNGSNVGHFYSGDINVSGEYSFLLDIATVVGDTQNVKIYAIANEKHMTNPGSPILLNEKTTEAQLLSLSYTGMTNTASALPMYYISDEITLDLKQYGRASASVNTEGHQGHEVLAQTLNIDLSKSFAKVQFYAAKLEGSTSSLSFKKITALKDGIRLVSFLYPRRDLANVPTEQADKVFLNSPVEVTASLASHVDDPASYTTVSGYAYLFENPSGSGDWTVNSPDGRATAFEVIYEVGGVEHKGYVYLPAIERNKFYTVKCLINGEGNITLNVAVADWVEAENWSESFAFEYPTYQNPLVNNIDPSGRTFDNPTMYYNVDNNEKGAFAVYFNFTAPLYQEWTPTLFDALGTDYAWRVYSPDAGGNYTVLAGSSLDSDRSGGKVTGSMVSGNVWYLIKVFPLVASPNTNKVKLAVTYKPTWLNHNYYFMINGAEGDIAWADSGTDAEYIDIDFTYQP